VLATISPAMDQSGRRGESVASPAVPSDASSTDVKRGLVLGLGVMGSIHLRVLGQLEDVEVVAAVDPSDERRERAARRMPGLRTYAALGEALEATQPDFACLAAPAASLPELGREILAAGIPVLVEKPMAPSEDEALALIRDAEARGLLLAVGHVERCNPAVAALKKRMDEGQAGRIYQMHARRLSPFPDRDSMLGVALDLATHDIDVMRYLSGEEVERVYAETAQRLHDRAEDLICATLRFDGGATGLLETNWLTPTKVRELMVTGEAGTFVLDYLTQELSFFEHPTSSTDWSVLANMRGAGEGNMIRYALERREPILVEWESFLGALRGGPPPLATGHDGFAALSTARAIQRSGTEHEAVVPGYRALA
jgi:predicted dehydrogenase